MTMKMLCIVLCVQTAQRVAKEIANTMISINCVIKKVIMNLAKNNFNFYSKYKVINLMLLSWCLNEIMFIS